MIWQGLVARSLTRWRGPILSGRVHLVMVVGNTALGQASPRSAVSLLSIISPTLDTHLPRSTARFTSLGTLQQKSALPHIAAIFSLRAFRETRTHILLFRIWKGDFILTH
jgi:hypothetical protein